MFLINDRKESHERYEANRSINELIEKSFKASVQDFLQTPSNYTVRYSTTHYDRLREWNSPGNSIIPYASTHLGTSGCAIFVFHQGLRLQRVQLGFDPVPLAFLTDTIGKKGYYEPGKGTWHNLFDHYGLKRASNIQEIFDTLYIKEFPVVTLLVRNELYPEIDSTTGAHFINAVGIAENGLYIDDPNKSDRIFLEFEKILNSIQVAWLW